MKERVFCVIFVCIVAFGATVHISPSDGASALRSAINYRVAGDTLALGPGKFYIGDLGTGLYLLDSLTIIASDGYRSCTISAASSDLVDTVSTIFTAYFSSPRLMETKVIGLVIEGGKSIRGGGVLAYNGCPDFVHCTFRKNYADSSGGALFIANTKMSLIDCEVIENASESGGGIFAYNSELFIRGTVINSNQGNERGGGIFAVECNIDASSIELSYNNSWNGGGGMLVNVTGDISQSIFEANTGVNGACFMIHGTMHYDFTITNSHFIDNAGWEGGAVFLDSCEITIRECDFYGNSSIGYGGAAFLHRGRSLLTENKFVGNYSAGDGAGIFFYRDKSIISRNRFEFNHARTYGGALYVYGNSEPIVRENLFNSNKVFYGSAIYVEYQSIPTFIKNTVINNIGNMGASITVCEASLLRADSCFFSDNGSIENRVSGLGSTVANADSVYITNSNIYYNTLYSDAYWTNACSLHNDFRGNFWLTTDTTEIRGFLQGPCLIHPIAHDFILGVPGEPYTIYEIEAFSDNFVTPVDIIEHIGDTLWLQVIGQDRNPHLYEACVVRIRSDGAAGDIAVALAETDTCSGIYRGKVIIAQATSSDTLWRDDVFNRIRVNPVGDRLVIYTVIDTLVTKSLDFMPLSIAENLPLIEEKRISAFPNPFNSSTEITIPKGFNAQIFDVNGRQLTQLTEGKHVWSPEEKESGVYIIKMTGKTTVIDKKIVFVR